MPGTPFEGIEGDLNLSPRRAEWTRRHIGPDTHRWLEDDARYFLRQALSTPCLNVVARCDGTSLEDLEGRRYMDFHGNSVHQVGFADPAELAAIKGQLDRLRCCTRRYTNEPAVELARALAPHHPGGTSASRCSARAARRPSEWRSGSRARPRGATRRSRCGTPSTAPPSRRRASAARACSGPTSGPCCRARSTCRRRIRRAAVSGVGMAGMAGRRRLIDGVRGLGLLRGFELVRGGAPAAEEANRVMYAAPERGLSFKVSAGNVLTLTPPLTIASADLFRTLDIIEDRIAAVGP